MRISVALCTYNGELFLQEQLLSIVNQTLPPDELIICDDYSTDKTMEIINSFKESSPFPVIVYQNLINLGSTKNFEKAALLCSGDIIAFADQDDIWKPRKLEIISEVFLANPQVGYVFTNAELVDAQLNPLGVTLWESVGLINQEYQKYLDGKQFQVLLKQNVVTGATMAFNAQLKNIVLPFPEDWIHDGWIAILLTAMGISGVPIPDSLILYRQHGNQQIGANKNNFFDVVNTSLKTSANDYKLRAKSFQKVKERMITRQIMPDQEQQYRIELLDKKTAHLLKRELIRSSSGLLKFKTIFNEIKDRNYKYFSSGWRSIGRDLLFK